MKIILDILAALFKAKTATPQPPISPIAPPAPILQPAPTPKVGEAAKPVWNFVTKNTARLTEADYTSAAKELNVEVAAIKAITTVEAGAGGGFLPSGRPKILFEAHLFARLTRQKYNSTNPSISSQTWNRALYKGGEKEYDRLLEAMALEEQSALSSASWGLFQILGSNCGACGFKSPADFVRANVESEARQLQAFITFLKTNKLDVALRDKDWVTFAKKYNGPGYAANKYDEKLAEAYQKWK